MLELSSTMQCSRLKHSTSIGQHRARFVFASAACLMLNTIHASDAAIVGMCPPSLSSSVVVRVKPAGSSAGGSACTSCCGCSAQYNIRHHDFG